MPSSSDNASKMNRPGQPSHTEIGRQAVGIDSGRRRPRGIHSCSGQLKHGGSGGVGKLGGRRRRGGGCGGTNGVLRADAALAQPHCARTRRTGRGKRSAIADTAAVVNAQLLVPGCELSENRRTSWALMPRPLMPVCNQHHIAQISGARSRHKQREQSKPISSRQTTCGSLGRLPADAVCSSWVVAACTALNTVKLKSVQATNSCNSHSEDRHEQQFGASATCLLEAAAVVRISQVGQRHAGIAKRSLDLVRQQSFVAARRANSLASNTQIGRAAARQRKRRHADQRALARAQRATRSIERIDTAQARN